MTGSGVVGHRTQPDIPTRFRLVTAPASEPVTLAEAKSHLRVTLSTDDTYIATLIVAARESCEAAVNRSFVATTWDYVLDEFPYSIDYGIPVINIPKGDLISVTSVTYRDAAGSSQTLTANTNYLVVAGAPGWIYPAPGQYWPATQVYRPESVAIRCTIGYGASGSSVPGAVKQAILLLVGDYYRNREQTIVGTISGPLATGVQSLLDSVRWGDYR